jgi:NTP pyrophosphatase (non-canonical NTP hydrolase)
MNIREFQEKVHALAVSKGWYEGAPHATDPMWLGARLALIHSEVSEALEDVRDGHTVTTIGTTGKPCGLPTELADIIIRVLDLAASLNIDMQAALEVKHAYNETRPHRHGGRSL